MKEINRRQAVALQLEKLSRYEDGDTTTITYAAKGTPYLIQSKKKCFPYVCNSSGYWERTTFFVLANGYEVKEFWRLKDAKEWIEKQPR